uniref:Uncharacterized protein n=1 Tax=Rhizophora mucronata TaxID=61149 RepID=A0A2P2J7I2_RHIMU
MKSDKKLKQNLILGQAKQTQLSAILCFHITINHSFK